MKKMIYADFMETDYKGRLVLNNDRTFSDLAENGIWFEEGMALIFYTENFDEKGNCRTAAIEGIVEYDLDAERWVAKIDWNEIKNVSQLSTEEQSQL
jgi:hypothetical protein